MERFDAIIIGPGQAGKPLAKRLAKEGRRVAVIELANSGGTCINSGCTPTQTLVRRIAGTTTVMPAYSLCGQRLQ